MSEPTFEPTPKITFLEITALVVITALAAFLRFYRLSELPTGFHGDEGVLGLLAQHIWNDGPIGIYSPLGGGHPAGPDYFYVLPVQLLGNTIFAVRFAPAFFATLTVPLLYFVLRRYADCGRFAPAFALTGAFLLAVMNWHIHFSRIGFPLVIWPFFVLLASAATLEAIRRPSHLRWVLAGFAAGLGLYMYNAQPLFLLPLGLFVAGSLVWQKSRTGVLHRLIWLGTLIIVAVPLALAIRVPENQYSERMQRDSMFATGPWQEVSANGVPAQVGFLLKRYVRYWTAAVWEPDKTDPIRVDATEVTPILRWPLFLLVLAGVVLGWRHRAGSLFWLGLIVVLLMPLGYVVTTGGLARRSFAAAPFIAMFAALGAVEMVSFLKRCFLTRHQQWTSMAAMGLFLSFITYQNLHDYFVKVANSPEQAWVYCEEFTKATQYMKTLPADSYVYFLSERWTFNYEPRQFLAPAVRGEDRSRQFGQFDLSFNREMGRPVFIFLGEYTKEVVAMRDRYPGGQIIVGPPVYRNSDKPAFYAYLP